MKKLDLLLITSAGNAVELEGKLTQTIDNPEITGVAKTYGWVATKGAMLIHH